MDDLARIEANLKAKHSEQSKEDNVRAELFLVEQATSLENFQKLKVRLELFKKSISSRLPIFMTVPKNEMTITFCIGTSIPFCAKPAYGFRIAAGASDSAFSIQATDENQISLYGLTLEGVIDSLSKYVATEIENPRPYKLPAWVTKLYELGAQAVAVIGFFGAWFVIGMSWGVWGVFLGWLPAAVIAALLGALWPLVALILVYAIGKGL
ncbi:MAG: hypothetical protein WCL27_01980 [Betaproteobacteria bacterium]